MIWRRHSFVLRPLLVKVSTMSGTGDGGQLQLHSKFVAGFVCHTEKNEVETNADTFHLHGVSWGGVLVFLLHFLAFSSFPLLWLLFLRVGVLSEIEWNQCFNLVD